MRSLVRVVSRVLEAHEGLVWRRPKVHGYDNDRAVRVISNAPGKLIDYWRMTSAPDLRDFEVTAGPDR